MIRRKEKKKQEYMLGIQGLQFQMFSKEVLIERDYLRKDMKDGHEQAMLISE